MMKDERFIKKSKHKKQSLNGLYVVVAFGAGLLILLLNTISRGGWFTLLSIILILCLICIFLYIILILFSLYLLEKPETVILDEKEGKEKLQEIKQRRDGINIRIGYTSKQENPSE